MSSAGPDRGLIARLLRRRHYRTTGPFLERFRCTIQIGEPGEPDAVSQSVDIEDCSLGGASLIAPVGGAIEPSANTMLDLRMQDVRSQTEHTLTGHVVRAQRDDGAIRFAVQFIDFDRLVPVLEGEWWRVFNRRRVLRTSFKIKERRSVQFIGPDVSTKARLADVSVEGAGLDLPLDLVDRFGKSGDCFLKIAKFPGLSTPPLLAGTVRHGTLIDAPTGRVARVGVSWRPARTKNWITVQAALVQLVDGRHRRERAKE